MPAFKYRSLNAKGKSVNGVMTAGSSPELELLLQEDGQTLLESEQIKAEDFKSVSFGKGKIKARELIDFYNQMRSLMMAGVTLLDGIKGIRDGIDNERFKAILEETIISIEAGNNFWESLQRHEDVFSEQMVNMIKAGEESGKLPETFEEISRYLEWAEGLKKDIQQATIYPVAVLVVLTLFITVLFTFVVPKFVELLVSLDVPLPIPTKIVMWISNMFVQVWWLIGIIVIGAPLLVIKMYKKSEGFAYKVDSLKLKLPIFGNLNHMFTVARFAQNFSSLFRSGIPVLQNMELCEGLVGNKVMEKAIKEARRDVESGLTLLESLRKHPIFTKMELLMISIGESSGDLGGALDNVSSYYNEQIPRTVKKIFSIIEPLVMLVLIGVVGFTALAIFMPILSLMGNMG